MYPANSSHESAASPAPTGDKADCRVRVSRVRGLFQNDKGVDAFERATLNANALNNRTSRNMEFENSLNFMKVKTHRI